MEINNTTRKGIILAGGSGVRLYPLTAFLSKQLLPVYNKPMIFYPLSTLMLAGIKDILIISTPEALPQFTELLGDGSALGISLSYAVQTAPRGLADALIVAEGFLSGEPCALILGDNLFHGNGLSGILGSKSKSTKGATIFAYHVSNPTSYGVVEFDPKSSKVLSIEEKPEVPKSNYVVTGLYFFDETAPRRAKQLKPSSRGEIEITDLNKSYLNDAELEMQILHRGIAWFDTGTHNDLLEASNYIRAIETRQGERVGCLEEVALNRKFINQPVCLHGKKYEQSDYWQRFLTS
jgi:glucose-1-phosphate thymidylyltransferase